MGSQIDESKEEWVDNIDFSSSAPSWVWPEASRRQRQRQSLHQKAAGTKPYAHTLTTVTSSVTSRLHKMLTWNLGCSGATTSVAMKPHALTSLSTVPVRLIAATYLPTVMTRARMPHAW